LRFGPEWLLVDVLGHPSPQSSAPIESLGLRPEHLRRRLYLKSANGQVLSGVAALAGLWAQTPGYEWLSKLVSLPLPRSVAEALYDHIAVPILVALERWRRAEPAHHGRILGS